jgi:hypothetical protein
MPVSRLGDFDSRPAQPRNRIVIRGEFGWKFKARWHPEREALRGMAGRPRIYSPRVTVRVDEPTTVGRSGVMS